MFVRFTFTTRETYNEEEEDDDDDDDETWFYACGVTSRNGDVFSGNSLAEDRGAVFCFWSAVHSSFHTVFPPNSISCAGTGNTGVAPYHAVFWGVLSATSYHSGGCNVLMFDGSVLFVSETINCGNAYGAQTENQRSDASRYGIWGAMGTPEGGESVKL